MYFTAEGILSLMHTAARMREHIRNIQKGIDEKMDAIRETFRATRQLPDGEQTEWLRAQLDIRSEFQDRYEELLTVTQGMFALYKPPPREENKDTTTKKPEEEKKKQSSPV